MKPYLSRVFIYLVAVLCATTSCSSEDPIEEVHKNAVCGVNDPIKDLKWLDEAVKTFTGGPEVNGVVLYTYNDQNIIEVQNSLFSSTNMHQHFCSGEKLNLEDPKALEDYRQKRVEVKILYGTNIWQ